MHPAGGFHLRRSGRVRQEELARGGQAAISKGEETGGLFVLDSHVLPNVHPSVIPALTGTGEMGEVRALGAVETICAVSAVQAGDVAAKAANVRLLEIRLARGLGGKGILLLMGDLGSVESSMEAPGHAGQ